MLPKLLPKQTVLIVYILIGLGYVLASSLLIYSTTTKSSRNNSSSLVLDALPAYEEKVVKSDQTVRLYIPQIGINSALEDVGITPEGNVASPKSPTNASWFNLGPYPGERGSAVIVGHYGWKDNIPAVFDNLHKLEKGDKIYILDEKGATTTFVVSELRKYGDNEQAPEAFSSNDGKAHLNLITCSGVWNKADKSYSKRLVVFTDMH